MLEKLFSSRARVEILKLFPHFYQCLDPGGVLILSGLLREQVDVVQKMFGKYGFAEHETFREEEWAFVVCIKQP